MGKARQSLQIQRCRVCGCTETCACEGGCWWVEPDLCSACQPPGREPTRCNYAIEQRLRLIDFLLCHYGMLNRSAIEDYFGVSTPQASSDIRLYLQRAPANATYDKSRKAYVRTQSFHRLWN